MDHDRLLEQLREPHPARYISSGEEPTIRDPETPGLESIAPHPVLADVEMVDDSANTAEHSSSNFDSESDVDALGAEMQAVVGNDVEDPPLPEIEPVNPPAVRSNNRRARVEDDEDDERDRRHPTQRVINPSSLHSTRSTTPLIFNPGLPTVNIPTSSPRNPANAPPAPQVNAPGRRMHPFLSGGIAISIDLDGRPLSFGPPQVPGEQPTPRQPGPPEGIAQEVPTMPEGFGGPFFAGLMSNPTFLTDVLGIEPDIDDPERADRLLNGLEDVPVGLVRRLERVGGMAGSTGGELSGGDSGCAVCWEKLLEVDASSNPEGVEKTLHPKVVSLPCAHVFHAECLRPWFSQPKQTTCPTCRFNIDPENLTFVPYRQRQGQAQTTAASGSETQPNERARGSEGPPSESPSSPVEEPRRGPPRRADSEPPLNRIPRPGPLPDMMQSFALPGAHVVIVSQPISIISLDGSRQPPQNGAPPQAATPIDNLTSPPDLERHPPVFSAPPGVGGQMPPLHGNLPEGVVAFDIHFPIHPSFFHGAQQPTQPQPPPQPQTAPAQMPQPPLPPRTAPAAFRFPGALAGVNFGSRPGGGETAVNVTNMFRRIFENMAPGGQQTANTPAQDSGGPAPRASTGLTTPTTVPATSPSGSNQTTQTSPPSSSPGPPGGPPPANLAGDTGTHPGAPPGDNANGPQLHANSDAFWRLLVGSIDPGTLLRLLVGGGPMPGFGLHFGRGGVPEHQDAIKREWSPPPAPGHTLRQRIERREREAGLRCSDVSCGIGPSDEEPFISLSGSSTKQLSIHPVGDVTNKVCLHEFHSACLVSAERVASRGADASIVGNDVEVSCPVCKGVGCVSRADWDEGVFTLQ